LKEKSIYLLHNRLQLLQTPIYQVNKRKDMLIQEEKTEATDDRAVKKKEIYKTPLEFALALSEKGSFDLSDQDVLILKDMDPSDFIDATIAPTPSERLKMLLNMMGRYGLELHLEGSIHLGDFSIADRSWRIETTRSSHLSIKVKPAACNRLIDDLVNFLQLLPQGQAYVLKPCQDLFLGGLSSESLIEYYNLCQQSEDPMHRDVQQQHLFEKNSQILTVKGLSLKIFGIHAQQLERMIDVKRQGVIFKAVAKDEKIQPSIIIALVKK
jgi:hypothetical protein